MTDQLLVDTATSDAEERCTLASQGPAHSDTSAFETLPSGERNRYLMDYDWKDVNNMTKPIPTNHCTGVVVTLSSITTPAPETPAPTATATGSSERKPHILVI